HRLIGALAALLIVLGGDPVAAQRPPATDSRFFGVRTTPIVQGNCHHRDAPILEYDVDVTRVVSTPENYLPGDPGKLLNTSTMVSEGLLGAEAMLTINLWDNNYCGYSPSYCPNNPPDNPWLPVFDSIEVNGCSVGQLTSEQNRTVKNKLKVPVSCLKFGVYQGNGNPPTPGKNKVRITGRIQADKNGQPDCGNDARDPFISSVYLEIKALHPAFLIHGIDTDIFTWTDRGFISTFVDKFVPHQMLYLQRQNGPLLSGAGFPRFPDGTIPGTGGLVANAIQRAATEYGANRVHLIAHSKGGLWSRHFMTDALRVGVYSLTTLDTPHRGSVAASVAEADRLGLRATLESGLSWEHIVAAIARNNPSQRDLTPTAVWYYSLRRKGKLPKKIRIAGEETKVRYWAHLGEANLNNNVDSNNYGIIECGSGPADECDFDPRGAPGAYLPPKMYRLFETISDVATVTVNGKRQVSILRAAPPVPNDFAVALGSMTPDPSLDNAFSGLSSLWFWKKNQRTIKDTSVALAVRTALTISLEQERESR
ncbi:MAG: esterase/lipase family protein, partial [Bryobacteraceae bacterium]